VIRIAAALAALGAVQAWLTIRSDVLAADDEPAAGSAP
jgi:hypothetical protein